MTIKTNQEGQKLLNVLCDAALKSAGLQAIGVVSRVLNSIAVEPDKITAEEDGTHE